MSAITYGSSQQLPKLRLTKRGRAVLTTLAAVPLVIIAALYGLNAGGASASADTTTTNFMYVSVAPGESLWQLATELAPQSDPREVVDEIMSLNRLDSADVQAGQQLAVPTEYSR